jgi:hypothetical protein
MRHAAHKATTRRDERAASLRCTGRPRAFAGKAARRPVVLPYRRDVPARKRPTPEGTVTARQILLDGLARDVDIFELVSDLTPLHPRDNTFPGEVFLRLAAGKTRSSSTRCWPQQPSMAAPTPTCLMRSPGGRPTTSGNTPCLRPSPTSAPPPAGRACRYARHARTWPSAPGTQRHNDQFGTPCERSSERGATDHNGGDGARVGGDGSIALRDQRL